jgi:hypothetical protein
MALAQLKLLVNLARVDGEVAEREKKYITNIGLANGVPLTDVMQLLDRSHDNIDLSNLTDELKFSYLLSLVQLMKIDERLYQEEIRYCSQVASRLGYEQTVMFDMMLHVRETMEDQEKRALHELTKKYLSK